MSTNFLCHFAALAQSGGAAGATPGNVAMMQVEMAFCLQHVGVGVGASPATMAIPLTPLLPFEFYFDFRIFPF